VTLLRIVIRASSPSGLLANQADYSEYVRSTRDPCSTVVDLSQKWWGDLYTLRLVVHHNFLPRAPPMNEDIVVLWKVSEETKEEEAW